MLEELHAPAPSPIFLATGARPLPEQDLKVKVHDTRGRLELKTQSLQITIDRPAATLTMLNLETRASAGWVFSFTGQAAATPTPVPAATVPPTFTNLTRQQNTWSFSFQSPAGDTTVTLELLHAGMATLSIARPGPSPALAPAAPASHHSHCRSRPLLRPRRTLLPGGPFQYPLRRPSRRPLRRTRPQLELRSHPPGLHPHRPRPLCRHSL